MRIHYHSIPHSIHPYCSTSNSCELCPAGTSSSGGTSYCFSSTVRDALLDFKSSTSCSSPCTSNPCDSWTGSNYCSGSWTGISCTNGLVTRINLYGRLLSGSLPASWSTLTGLTSLDISTNVLTGRLPMEWSNLVGLSLLYLYSNQLTSTIPQEWTALTNLNQAGLDLNDTSICGSIPLNLIGKVLPSSFSDCMCPVGSFFNR